jgi:tetratricopeptide (TPR) repeat protein
MNNWLRVLSGLLVVAAVAGCADSQEQRRMTLVQGERAFQNRQYDTAIGQLTAFLSEARDQPETGRALYVRGMALALTDQRPQAYADLERAARDARDPQVAWRAQAVLGVMRFEDQEWAGAAQALGSAASAMPAGPPLDAVLFRLGLCQERLGRWGEAQTQYRRIVSQFTQGTYPGLAQRRLDLKADHFAVQCGAFAQVQNASAQAAQLQRAGLPAQVQRDVRGGATPYVVFVGRYATYAEAVDALARVRAIVPDAVIWP